MAFNFSLASLHRKLSAMEFRQLEDNILADGRILDPIIMWKDYVLDGVHRLQIAEKHGLEYDVQVMDFECDDDAAAWVVTHQLGKRNLSDIETARLRAEQAKILGTQAVADAHNVNVRTLQRDVVITNALKLMSEDILARFESGSLVAYKSDWIKYAALTDAQRTAVDDALRRDPSLRLGQAIPSKDCTLTLDDFSIINASSLPERQKRSISLGSIRASKDAVHKLRDLEEVDQQMVMDILDDPEVDDLGDAIALVSGGFKQDANKKAKQVVDRINKAFDTLIEALFASSDPVSSKCIPLVEQAKLLWGRK